MKVRVKFHHLFLSRFAQSSRPVEIGIIDKPMLEAFGASDPGCVRANNEDYYLLAPGMGLYIVADGMGGAQAGEHASKLAAETVWEVVHDTEKPDAETLLEAFDEANRRVMDAAAADMKLEGNGNHSSRRSRPVRGNPDRQCRRQPCLPA